MVNYAEHLTREHSMTEMTAVRWAVERVLAGELEPMLDLLADDVVFHVEGAGDSPLGLEESGRQAVADYFTALGQLVTFWQMDYTARGDQLIAWGRESFTIENCELEGGCEFALLFDLSGGRISRFLVVEDLPSFIRDGRLQPSTNRLSPSSIIPQFFSEWDRASSVGLLSWVRETRVPSPSGESWIVTV
jgi:ketosteroid isomerase-like protein